MRKEKTKWEYDSFSKERFITEKHGDDYRQDFERDRARLIHSSALRRLGDKLKFFHRHMMILLADRLAHSLEVAQIRTCFSPVLELILK